VEKSRAHQTEDRWLLSQSQRVIGFLTREIEKIKGQLSVLRDAHAKLKADAWRLEEAIGIGQHSALALLGSMPELGTLGRRAVAEPAGLAPPSIATAARCVANAASPEVAVRCAVFSTWQASAGTMHLKTKVEAAQQWHH
jgi:hypothetical protein